ncbi:succinate dehydrogenase assembly factor 2 [Rhodobacteraceae bacterium KMM 6894]|nr:succinate dehydrogenase assembly factor 2 [Rhodobacteraceae bacterium KMM 6894]
MPERAPETHEMRLRRLTMRSMRRGIKEMDIILTRFAQMDMADLSAQSLDLYDDLLEENDQDLYQWVTGQVPAPARFMTLIQDIAARSGASGASK